jgi:long-chain acyl-CoA synthetase
LADSGARFVITLDLLYERLAATWEAAGVEQVIVGTAVDFMPRWKRVAARIMRKVPSPKEPVPYGARIRPYLSFVKTAGTSGKTSGRDGPRWPPAHAGIRPTDHAAVNPSDTVVLQYTGGTTGLPMGATLTHRTLLANARQMRGWFPSLRDGEETLLAALPFFHVYGQTLVMNTGVLLGARSVLIARPVVIDILRAIKKYRASIFPGVPTLYVAVVNDPRSREYDLSSVNVCVSGGAPLPLEVKREFEKITGGHLYEGYGLSEASPVTHAEPYDGRSRAGSMGLPMPDTEARVLDEDGRAVPVGSDGELTIRGPQVMRGYWNRPEETAAVLDTDGWLRTGDIARMDEDGWFYIVDRKKDLIITGGENIYPREVEEVLFEHPAVQEAAVVGVRHPFGGEIAKAFVVLKEGETATKKDIIQFAGQRLTKYKVPRAVEFRTELPKSAAQKVLRRVLAEEERKRQAERPPRRSRAPDPDP